MQIEVLQFLIDWNTHYGVEVPVPFALFRQLPVCNWASAYTLCRGKRKIGRINNYETYKNTPHLHIIYFDRAEKHHLIYEMKKALKDYVSSFGLKMPKKIKNVVWLDSSYYDYVKKNYNLLLFNSPLAKLRKEMLCTWYKDEHGWTFKAKGRGHIMERVGILKYGWKNVPKPYKVDKFYCREFFTPGGWDLRWWY